MIPTDVSPRSFRRDFFKKFGKLLRVVGVIHSGFSTASHFYFHIQHDKLYPRFGYSFKFFGVWSSLAQLFYFGTACGIDFSVWREFEESRNRAIKTRNYSAACFAFPASFIASSAYWGIVYHNRRYLGPDLGPYWLTHMLHTSNLVIQVLDTILLPKVYPKMVPAMAGLSAFTCSYMVWIHIIHSLTGVWVYPMLDDLKGKYAILAHPIFFLAYLISFLIGKAINHLFFRKKNQHITWTRNRYISPASRRMSDESGDIM